MKRRVAAMLLGMCMVFTACGVQSKPLTPLQSKGKNTAVEQDVSSGQETAVEQDVSSNQDMTTEQDAAQNTAAGAVWLDAEKTQTDILWDFSYQLLKECLEKENPVLSPISAYLAMGMAGLGARGETLAEFEAVMGTEMHNISSELVSAIPGWLADAEEQSILEVANSAWVDTELLPEEAWLKAVADGYAAEVFQTELASTSARKDINAWVEKNTHGLIKGFLEKNLSEKARLALFNTVYFKGEWQEKFKERNTYKEAFTAESGKTKDVEMMHAYRRQEVYLKNERMDGVVLPYRYGSMAFVALKPTNGETVRELYEELTAEELNALLEEGEKCLMNLKLPKFEIEFDINLKSSLENMGLKKAFDENNADFTGIGVCQSGAPLHIDLVRQKAVVKMDEEGTEAAAVTMVVANESAMIESEEPIEVYFDEPFFYMIMDMESRTPLFMGIMDAPWE